jgi:proliferating cell nuclear antigen
MLVKLENPSLLLKPIELLSEIVTEVKIKINDFGMSITALDPANVAMVGLRIPKAAFSQFETGTETLGVNLDSLKKILKRCNNGSSLVIEKKENLLNFSIDDKIKRNFTLSLIEIDGHEKEIPSLEFSGKIEITSSDFIDSVEDCAIVADACSFIIKDGKFLIESKGLNSSRAEFSSDDTKIEGENCKSRYSLEYLQKFAKGCKLSPKTLLSFADDHPLRMDIKTEHMNLIFILAPRVETED